MLSLLYELSFEYVKTVQKTPVRCAPLAGEALIRVHPA